MNSVSGFFSEDVDKKGHWTGLTKHLEYGQQEVLDSNAAVFSLTWESKTNKELYAAIIKTGSTVAF